MPQFRRFRIMEDGFFFGDDESVRDGEMGLGAAEFRGLQEILLG